MSVPFIFITKNNYKWILQFYVNFRIVHFEEEIEISYFEMSLFKFKVQKY